MRRLSVDKAKQMKQRQQKPGKAGVSRRWQWCIAGLGMLAIAALLYAFASMVQEHMAKAREVSRDTQWTAHAPVEAARAAAVLQGAEP